MKAQHQRNAQIVRWHLTDRLTYAEIATRLGLSRARIGQILKRQGANGRVPPAELVIKLCLFCKGEFSHHPRRLKPAKFCSRICFNASGLLSRLLTNPDAKWSRVGMHHFICETCHDTFRRSHFIQSISNWGAEKAKRKLIKHYCSRKCYFGRGVR